MTKDTFLSYIRNHLLLVSFYVKDIILNGIAASSFCPMCCRKLLYACYGHKNDLVYSHCTLGVGGGKLNMMKGSYINSCCFLDLGADIIIGHGVSIAMGCSFINSTHKIGSTNRRAVGSIKKSIIIGDGVWIGCNVTILPGVKIGNGVVVAAGAVVIDDCDANYLYAGVPAKRIKELN